MIFTVFYEIGKNTATRKNGPKYIQLLHRVMAEKALLIQNRLIPPSTPRFVRRCRSLAQSSIQRNLQSNFTRWTFSIGPFRSFEPFEPEGSSDKFPRWISSFGSSGPFFPCGPLGTVGPCEPLGPFGAFGAFWGLLRLFLAFLAFFGLLGHLGCLLGL